MSTLQTTPRLTGTLPHRVNAVVIAIAVLMATAVAVALLAPSGTRTSTAVPSVAAANDTSAAYAPPHTGATIKPSPVESVGGLTRNDQGSSAYIKAELYNTAR
jgi:hypothetical protein